MSDTVLVSCYLPLHKKGRTGTFVETYAVKIVKPTNWAIVDFFPFAIEESSDYGIYRSEFTLESYNTVTNEAFLKPYEVARSKSWPIQRCLMGCGWESKGTRKLEVRP